MTNRLKSLCLMLLLAPCAGRALAHNPMTSWAVARLREDRVELGVDMSAESAWVLLGESATSAPGVGLTLRRLKELAPSLYKVSSGGEALAPVSADVELRDEDGVGFLLVYRRALLVPLGGGNITNKAR